MVTLTFESTQRRLGQLSSLTVAVDPEGSIVVNEGTWYGTVDDDDGREYDDVLELPALEAGLLCALLRRSRGGRSERPSHPLPRPPGPTRSVEATARELEDAYHGQVFRCLDDLALLLDRHGLAYERSTQLLLA